MKNILLPCDFSNASREAFKVALEMASKSKAEIILLHSIYIPVDYDFGLPGQPSFYNSVYIHKMEEEANKAFAEMKVRALAIPVKTTGKVVFGELISSIKSIIQENDIGLVIMGTSGTSGLSEFHIGSNTEKAVRYLPVPVLAIKKSFAMTSIKHIVVPTPLTLNNTNYIKRVKELQHTFSATLHILYVNTPAQFMSDSEVLQSLDDFVSHHKLEGCKTHVRNHYTEEEGIIDFLKNKKMDLIAMGTHARKGLAHFFNGSIAEDMIQYVDIPVWTYTLRPEQNKTV